MNRRKCTGTTASDRKFLTCLDDTSCQQWAFIALADGEHFRNQCAQEREERTGHMRPCTPSIGGVLLLLGPFLQQYVDGKDSNTSSEFRRTQTSGRCYPDNSVSTRTSSYGCHAAKFCSNQLSAERLGTMSLASCNTEAVDFEWFSSFSSLLISFLIHRFNNFNISPSLQGGVLFTAVVADGLCPEVWQSVTVDGVVRRSNTIATPIAGSSREAPVVELYRTPVVAAATTIKQPRPQQRRPLSWSWEPVGPIWLRLEQTSGETLTIWCVTFVLAPTRVCVKNGVYGI